MHFSTSTTRTSSLHVTHPREQLPKIIGALPIQPKKENDNGNNDPK